MFTCCVFWCLHSLIGPSSYELLLPFNHLPSPLWPHQQGIVIHTTAVQWMSSLFCTILCKPWGWLWVNIPVEQGLLNYWNQSVSWVHLGHIQNPLNSLSSPLWCWFDLQQVVWTAFTVASVWVSDYILVLSCWPGGRDKGVGELLMV